MTHYGAGGFGDLLIVISKFKNADFHKKGHTLHYFSDQQKTVELAPSLMKYNGVIGGVQYVQDVPNYIRQLKGKGTYINTIWNGDVSNNPGQKELCDSDGLMVPDTMEIFGIPAPLKPNLQTEDDKAYWEAAKNAAARVNKWPKYLRNEYLYQDHNSQSSSPTKPYCCLQVWSGFSQHNERKYWKDYKQLFGFGKALVEKYDLDVYIIGNQTYDVPPELIDTKDLGLQIIEYIKGAKFVIGLSSFVSLVALMSNVPVAYKKEADAIDQHYFGRPSWTERALKFDEIIPDLGTLKSWVADKLI